MDTRIYQFLKNTASRFFVFLSLIFVAFSCSAQADLPLCSTVFTNAVQTHGVQGNFVQFGFNARITNSSDDQLHVPLVEYNPWSVQKSCGTAHCSAGGDPVPQLWITNFLGTGSSVKYLVPPKKKMIIGDSAANIGEVDIREYTTAEFSSRRNFFVIDRLFVGHKATLRLPEGSYWIRDFRMEVESRVEVIGDGSVNLYVQNSLDIPFKALINVNTKDPSRLTIYDESSSHFHVGSTTYAFIVTENEFILGHGAKLHGGLVGQFIYLESASEVAFNAEAAQAINIPGLCRSQGLASSYPPPYLFITGRTYPDGNVITVDGELITADGSVVPITSVTARAAQNQLPASITGTSTFNFTLEQALLDNYVTVVVHDASGNEYTNEFNLPYYPSALFSSIYPPHRSVVYSQEIPVYGQINTPWPAEELTFMLDEVVYPLVNVSEGVYQFNLEKTLQSGPQTLRFTIIYPYGQRSVEQQVTYLPSE